MKRHMIERVKLVKAMEMIARNINDESVFMDYWLTNGVADGDIEYADLTASGVDDEDIINYYCSDDVFADLMSTFLYVMMKARNSGGLYCDGITSGE